MRHVHRLGGAKPAFLRQAERLTRENPLHVSLLFIPFFIVTILTIYVGFQTAPRLFGVGKPLEKISEISPDHEVWLSLAVKKEKLIITVSDGQVFSWSVEGPGDEDLEKLQFYLRQRAEEIVRDSVRRGQVDEVRGVAALSVDQGLTYHHIRPVIFALAGAGFSKYGFETRVLR